jgi:hypothetical protein
MTKNSGYYWWMIMKLSIGLKSLLNDIHFGVIAEAARQ